MPETTRWGILGLGRIAGVFAEGLKALPDAELVAVGSRTQEKAERFGEEHGAPRRYGSYAALAADPEVDAVYVASPHPMHCEDTILCLEHGKAVLCEKPFAANKMQAERMVQTAREKKVFLMEAMWTRFLPAIKQVSRWIEEGAIGEPRMVVADFGLRAEVDAEGRLFAPAYAGGGLLDVGVYAISFASLVYGGPPKEIRGLAHLGETGVDDQNAMVLGYEGGAMALLCSAIRTNTPQEARILGTEGMIHVPSPFWSGAKAVLTRQGKEPEKFEHAHTGNGYEYEAAAVAACLHAGETECARMPLDESLSIMGTMDRLRADWGLVYPCDQT